MEMRGMEKEVETLLASGEGIEGESAMVSSPSSYVPQQ